MAYDDAVAARYDEHHHRRFEEAGTAVDLLAELAGPGPVLELGVGTGRLALPLSRRGLDVHGVDTSPAMLERLRAKPGAERVHTIEGNMADVASLAGGLRYRLVFVAFNTLFELGSQEDQVRCFQGVAACIDQAGGFVVEAIAPDADRLEESLTAIDVTDATVTLQASRHDPSAQVVDFQDVVIGNDNVTLHHRRIRYATPAELDLMARLAGLELRGRWGGWQREPFTAASERHVSVYGPATPR